MESGKLRHWITVETLTTSPDSSGQPIETWSVNFRTWAACQRIGSREFPAFQRRNSETTARFVIRYRDGLTLSPATNRIIHAGKTWNISDPIPDTHNRQLMIEASELT